MKAQLIQHVGLLRACDLCPKMHKPVVSCGPVVSQVMLIGQAPGIKEPIFGRPFAWTAGKTLFKWFESVLNVDEATFRSRVYMCAVCRCYPGKGKSSGDRVPDAKEVENCSKWMQSEFQILRPKLLIAVGKLAALQFISFKKLDEVVGQVLKVNRFRQTTDLIILPHSSGLCVWHRVSPGKELLKEALQRIQEHPAMQEAFNMPKPQA